MRHAVELARRVSEKAERSQDAEVYEKMNERSQEDQEHET
jgi:hypothetical protein